jgi:hypothetical protein
MGDPDGTNLIPPLLGDIIVAPHADGFLLVEAVGRQPIQGPFPSRDLAAGVAQSLATKRRARCWFENGGGSVLIPGSPMDNEISRHIELLNTYHLDLWSEIEAQLRVIRTAQVEIEKLRELRHATDGMTEARASADMLARHVDTLTGRVEALTGTIAELKSTVNVLRHVLAP